MIKTYTPLRHRLTAQIIGVTAISCNYCFHTLWLEINWILNFLLTKIFEWDLMLLMNPLFFFPDRFCWFKNLYRLLRRFFQDLFTFWSFTMQSGELSGNPPSFASSSPVNCYMSDRSPTYPVPGHTFMSNFASCTLYEFAVGSGLFSHCPDCMVNDQSVNWSWKNRLGGLCDTFS